MTKPSLSRRSVLQSGAGAAALATVGAAPGFAQSDTRLRMFWWGPRTVPSGQGVNKL